jgi:phytoene dehydrogenase-like protein
LVASITCAEAGAEVELFEAHQQLGGRARTTAGDYIAHDGPHVLYSDGPWWDWLRERDLLGAVRKVPLSGLAGFYFRYGGRLHRKPPPGVLRLLASRAEAPVDSDFFSWVAGRHGPEVAAAAANLMGVATFDADPGRLSAAFVWERMRRVFSPVAPARYVVGGWGALVDRLAERATGLGVRIQTGSRVETVPRGPVIVATSLEAAARLLEDPALAAGPASGRTVLLDLGLSPIPPGGGRRRDAFVVSDAAHAGWLERFSLPDPSLAPPGHALVQAQMPVRETESRTAGTERLEALADLALPHWRERTVWRRDGLAWRRTGALDLPGQTWRDRPAVDRGDGVFLAGDRVAAPGLLSEVAFASGRQAAAGALAAVAVRT